MIAYFLSAEFKNYYSNPGIYPSAISFFHLLSRFINKYYKQIKIIQQNLQLIKNTPRLIRTNVEEDI